jgi:hypothetical protein
VADLPVGAPDAVGHLVVPDGTALRRNAVEIGLADGLFPGIDFYVGDAPAVFIERALLVLRAGEIAQRAMAAVGRDHVLRFQRVRAVRRLDRQQYMAFFR